MPKEMEFFILLIESYAKYKNKGADEIFNELEDLNLTNEIYNMYEMYHSEAIENAFMDIDKLIAEKHIK